MANHPSATFGRQVLRRPASEHRLPSPPQRSEPTGSDALHPEQLGGFHPAVPSDDQHRIREAEPQDAVGDLPDLLLGVGAGIAPTRLRAAAWPPTWPKSEYNRT
jgi:hypothetical protein